MTVYFYDDKDHEQDICSIEYEGCPCFKVGEKITLQINNNVPDKWDVETLPFTEFKIKGISHHALKYYGSSVNYQTLMYVTLNKIT